VIDFPEWQRNIAKGMLARAEQAVTAFDRAQYLPALAALARTDLRNLDWVDFGPRLDELAAMALRVPPVSTSSLAGSMEGVATALSEHYDLVLWRPHTKIAPDSVRIQVADDVSEIIGALEQQQRLHPEILDNPHSARAVPVVAAGHVIATRLHRQALAVDGTVPHRFMIVAAMAGEDTDLASPDLRLAEADRIREAHVAQQYFTSVGVGQVFGDWYERFAAHDTQVVTLESRLLTDIRGSLEPNHFLFDL
jgi:hypothetical protein